MVATYLFMKNVWQTMFLQVDLEKLLSDVRATDLMWHDLAVYNVLGFHFSDSEYCFSAYIWHNLIEKINRKSYSTLHCVSKRL